MISTILIRNKDKTSSLIVMELYRRYYLLHDLLWLRSSSSRAILSNQEPSMWRWKSTPRRKTLPKYSSYVHTSRNTTKQFLIGHSPSFSKELIILTRKINCTSEVAWSTTHARDAWKMHTWTLHLFTYIPIIFASYKG